MVGVEHADYCDSRSNTFDLGMMKNCDGNCNKIQRVHDDNCKGGYCNDSLHVVYSPRSSFAPKKVVARSWNDRAMRAQRSKSSKKAMMTM